uniref:Uncharacterized protein n=1 Tax=Rhizophora mucronata TaxID=61149 RepID=A0A2P2PN37_RHIMU
MVLLKIIISFTCPQKSCCKMPVQILISNIVNQMIY